MGVNSLIRGSVISIGIPRFAPSISILTNVSFGREVLCDSVGFSSTMGTRR